MAKTRHPIWDVPPEDIINGAAAEWLSFEDYVIKYYGSMPPIEEVVEQIRSHPPLDLGGKTGADWVREAREERDAELDERWSSSTRRQ